MPRPKPSKALPFFYSRGYKLSDGARAKLIELLGYGNPNQQDPAGGKDLGKIIREIETALGIYLDGYQHLDYIPRPADYVAVFKPLYREANKLRNDLSGLSGYYNEQLKLQGMNVHSFMPELGSLVDAANAVVEDFENRGSKGAPKQNALKATVRQLRTIFRDHYEGPKGSRRRQGGFQYLADCEKREHDFVKVALRDSHIIAEGYKGLPRLFRDRRSEPNGDSGSYDGGGRLRKER